MLIYETIIGGIGWLLLQTLNGKTTSFLTQNKWEKSKGKKSFDSLSLSFCQKPSKKCHSFSIQLIVLIIPCPPITMYNEIR